MAFKKKKVDLGKHMRGQPPEVLEKLKAAEKAFIERESKQLEHDMKALKEKIEAATAELEGKEKEAASEDK